MLAFIEGRINVVPARIYVAGEGKQVSRAAILGTLAAEKAFDTLFFLISGSLALILVPLPPWLNAPLVGGTAFGFLLVILALAWPHSRVVAWIGHSVFRFRRDEARRRRRAASAGR